MTKIVGGKKTISGRTAGRPRKQRKFVSNDSIEANFENMPRSAGGGAVITVDDHDELFNHQILANTSHQIEDLKVDEEGNILTITSHSKYSNKQDSLAIIDTPNDVQLPLLIQQAKLIKDLNNKNKSDADVSNNYDFVLISAFANSFGVKSTNRKNQSLDLVKLLRKHLNSINQESTFENLISEAKTEDELEQIRSDYKSKDVNLSESSIKTLDHQIWYRSTKIRTEEHFKEIFLRMEEAKDEKHLENALYSLETLDEQYEINDHFGLTKEDQTRFNKLNESLRKYYFKRQKELKSNKNHTLNTFKNDLKRRYDVVDVQERRGGMVPLNKIGPELEKQGYSKEQINDYLMDLEKKRVIELQVASDPKLVTDQTYSIKHPGRGLINYVVFRKPVNSKDSEDKIMDEMESLL